MSSIDILPSDEQLEIVEGLVRALENAKVGETDVTAVAELGFLGAGLSEDHGGFGLTVADEALLHVEFGRSVSDLRVLAAMLGARLAAASGDADLATALVAGSTTAGFAVPATGWATDASGPSGDVFLVGQADLYLALSPYGACLIPLDRFADRRACESMDATAPATRATLSAGGIAWSETDLWNVSILLVAAQLAGIAAATRDMGAEYAKTREQFDKPIGAFQGIAHPLADCALRAEAAANLIYYAAIAQRDGFADAARQVTAACIVAMDAALRNATTNIQTHGAMGYSAETGAGLFLKRAVTLRHIAGGVRLHERRVLEEAA